MNLDDKFTILMFTTLVTDSGHVVGSVLGGTMVRPPKTPNFLKQNF